MARAVAVDPVKATPASRGSAVSIAPTSPPPGMSCKASGGMPAAWHSLMASAAISGVCGAGLASTVFPAASAAPAMPMKIASGKFHGAMVTNTPRPCSDRVFSSPVGPGRMIGAANCRRASAA